MPAQMCCVQCARPAEWWDRTYQEPWCQRCLDRMSEADREGEDLVAVDEL